MIIKDKVPETSVFYDLVPGDVFRYADDELYLKMENTKGLNAVALSDGCTYMIPQQAEVEPVKGSFVLE